MVDGRTAFSFTPAPHLIFGSGSFERLGMELSLRSYRSAAVVTGGKSLGKSGHRAVLERLSREIETLFFSVSGEPGPDDVDGIVEDLRSSPVDVIVAVGGGSVIDCGKAVSAMVPAGGSVLDYLEGIGTRRPTGAKIPFIAVPTTAGTGSEATKNAVISAVGASGFKKSLRHDLFVPDLAIVDPLLATSCPPALTASSGLDAVTQLLEAYVSIDSSPLTDALAETGLAASRRLPEAVVRGASIDARSGMAFAAFLSGVCLANAGLGVVHGIASPAGALRSIPHGVVCGTLLPEAAAAAVDKCTATGNAALGKYARAGELLSGSRFDDPAAGAAALVTLLGEWRDRFAVPRLGAFGFTQEDLPGLASTSGSKSSPVDFSADDIRRLLETRL